ncbi:hypothetical protein [Leptospira alstonii]|uniref:hypothetical protein n=1 Tax=Leptospira alstonii TaxID=28452 RepID=UPI000AA4B2C7|nr:hypothetical protein [Leptospira alstonii]
MDYYFNSILAASISILASVITASSAYYFTKRSQQLNDERRIKEEFFRQFIKALSDLAIDNSNRSASLAFSESINILLLIGSPGVVKALMNFHNYIRSDKTKTDGSSEQRDLHDELLRDLIKELRLDLFRNFKVNKNFPEIHLVGGPKRY